MQISVSLLLIFIGSTAAKKQGDFGLFTSCTINNTLRLECSYADCPGSPSYSCEFWRNETLLAKASDKQCRFNIEDHRKHHGKEITNYTCKLTRKGRPEVVNISIDYTKRKGKIKACPATTGLLLHQAPTLLWPVVILPLWTVLVTDRQET